jgi:hypothetical protein
MVAQYAQTLTGIPWLGTALMILAMAGFAAIILWTFRLNKEDVERMSRMPLEAEKTSDEETIA